MKAQYFNYIYNNAKLNATNIDRNITVTPLHSNVTINGSEWILSHNKHTAFDLKVHIKWGLGTYNDGRVVVNIKSNTNNRNTESLLMAISANNTEYISMIIAVNNTHNNKIYPGCSGNTGYGNIENIGNKPTYPTRIERITNGGNLSTLSNMNQPQLSNGRHNIWPIQWNFDNHPDCRDNGIDHNSCGNDLLFDFVSIDSSIQTCKFGNALPSNAGLDIFIGVANPGETLSINEIYIGYNYKATWPPTREPTANPSIDGTYGATVNPTISPIIKDTLRPTATSEVVTSTTLKYIDNVTVMVEVETDLNLTRNSSVVRDIVNVILSELIVNSNLSILATPIIRIKEINGGFIVAVIIEIGSDVEIDLDDDLINDIDDELEREVIDDVIIKDIIIDDKSQYDDDEEEEVINCGGIIVWCILVGIICFALLLMIISKCIDKTSCSIINAVCFMISVINLTTDGIVVFCSMQWYYSRNIVQDFTCSVIVYSMLLLVALPYIINIVFGAKHLCTSRGHTLLTMICVIISGDTYSSMRIIHGLLLKQIKIITVVLQNVPQMILQSLFFGWILQEIHIMVIISICCSFISCLTCFIFNDIKRIGFKNYGVKIRFIVSNEEETKNINNNFKANKDMIREELSLILMVKKDNIKIDGICINGINIEIDVIHSITDEIKNNVDNLYENEINKIGELVKRTFNLISDIEVKVINDRSGAFMSINSTSIVTDIITHYPSIHKIASISDCTPTTESPLSGIELVTSTGMEGGDIVTLGVPDPPKLMENVTVSSEGIEDINNYKINRNERHNSDDMYLQQNNNIFTDDGGGVTDDGQESLEKDNYDKMYDEKQRVATKQQNNNNNTNNGGTDGYIGQYVQYEGDMGVDV